MNHRRKRAHNPKIVTGRLLPTLEITVTGQVQGIGFRPYIYRLAKRLGISGNVTNTRSGVLITVQGSDAGRLLKQIRHHPPRLALITGIRVRRVKRRAYKGFTIIPSPLRRTEAGVELLPDLATCPACRREMDNPKNRRYLYPFINCTQCGPRYTIILHPPYDRERTSMARFRMCPECRREYTDPADRRFHAEPIACPECGPSVQLLDSRGRMVPGDPIENAARRLIEGKIIAIKSLGGFHLACDATNDRAVRRLRRLKGRDRKPLALMVESVDVARRLCRLTRDAARLLGSPAAPILLLPKRPEAEAVLSPQIAPANPALGILLPYNPLQRLIFQALNRLGISPPVLVMTSANRSEEPIAISDEELFALQPPLFDYLLTHNREIINRCDDSVLQAEPSGTVMVRRSRGYVPRPLHLRPMFHVKHPTLAVGADSKNCFALAAGGRVFAGPHIGELDSAAAEAFFRAALVRLCDWTGIRPARVVCDLHPDYSSVRLAERLAGQFRVPLVRVQHHYAHILSVMAEYGLPGPVLGLAADGTGYGVDGAIWGCELLLVNPDRSWQRLGHLAYLRHSSSGGYLADPERVAASYLLQAGISRQELNRHGLRPVPVEGQVVTSSLGRLFDAVAALTGVCRHARFEGEAAVALEDAALSAGTGIRRSSLNPDRLLIEGQEGLVMDPLPILRTAWELCRDGAGPGPVARWFHQTLIELLCQGLVRLARRHRVRTVCLSGGSLQNRLLRRGLKKRLSRLGLMVFYNRQFPLNDGGIALGQAVAPGR